MNVEHVRAPSGLYGAGARLENQAVNAVAQRSLFGADVHAELRSTAGGVVELRATPSDRVKVHVGAPMRCSCGEQAFVYTRGDIDILPAGMADAWEEDEPGTSLVLELTPSLVRQAAEHSGRDPDRIALEPRCQLRDPRIEHIAFALEAELDAGSPNGPIFIETLGLALATHLTGGYGTAPMQGLARGPLRRVTDYIEAHLDQNLSLAKLAAVAGVSASHLKASFKRSTGVPVHAYVMHRRVERARTLLTRTDRPASEVALDAGFAHQSHMARWMRRMLGCTPSDLRRSSASGGRRT